MQDLNRLYREEPALHKLDFSADGFEWIDCHGWGKSVVSFVRKDARNDDIIMLVCNFTPVPRTNYVLGALRGGYWREVLNSDAPLYGGSGMGNLGGVEAAPVAAQGRFHSVLLTLPRLRRCS